MTNTRNTNKTVANQYLNSILRFGAKPLMLLSILLTAMFILAACGGGAAAPAAVTPTADPCRGNPFGGTCNSTADQARRTTVVQTCLAAATANTPACAQAIIAEPCIVNPLGAGCAADADFIAYLPTGTTVADVVNTRATYCNGQTTTPDKICDGVETAQDACTVTAPFANALCDGVTGIAGLRTTYCNADATLWNDNCDAGEATYTGATEKRNMACLAEGTDADASCASRANVRTACNADPFTQTTGLTTNVDLCTGSTADTGGTTYESARMACAVAATSFDESCDSQDTIGDVKLARDMACAESGTTADDTCNVRPNIIADCDADDPFANTGCDTAAHILADSNAIRTTYCTTATTTFDADCTDGTDGMVNDARASLALACVGDDTTGIAGCDTFANGVDGTTVAMCSADPFLTADGCDANIAFNGIRTGICTTTATLFNPNCTNDTYDTSGGLRATLIEKCASPTTADVDCTTTFIDGSDTGTTVAMCITDPFLPACGTNVVDDTFATARTERNTLCAPTGSPFDATCNISTFGTDNDANRDTYCRTIAVENDPDCAVGRLAEICTTTSDSAYNPFALLCGTDSDNIAARAAFCLTTDDSGTNSNPDCATEEATLCAANPFGTNLGPSATINCVTGSTGDYAEARKTLADNCRTNSEGAGCTVAINRCNANPFSDTVFNGGACDRVAFANAQVPYCETDANPWQGNCDSLVAANDSIARARGDVCINNRAIPENGTNGDVLAAGESLFNAICADAVATDGTTLEMAQIGHCSMDENAWHTANCGTLETSNTAITQARANICVDNKEIDKGDGSPILAGMSLFSTDCEDVTAADGIRTGMTARAAWCTEGDNIFDDQCGADDADTYGATTAARDTACATTGDTPLTSVGTDECVSRADDICGINSAAGTNPFAAICSVATQNVNHVATLLDSQQAYCRDVANNPNEVCSSTITAVCGATDTPITTTTAIFDGLCLGADYEAAQRTYCSVTAILDDTSCKDNMQGSLSVKDVVCNGDDVADTPYSAVCDPTNNVMAQEAFCGLTDNSTATGCAATIAFACDETTTTGDPFHVLCTAPNEADRILRAESCRAGNVDTKICNDVVNNCNNVDPFDASCDSTVYASALVAFCTVGDDIFDTRCVDSTHGAVNAARLARCAGPIADLGTSSDTTTCLTESAAICGTMTVEGTSPFAEICGDANRNTNHADLVAIQGFYCGNNARRPGCTDDDVALVTSGDFARGQATPLNTDPTAESQFLEIAVDSNVISTTGTNTAADGTGVAPTPTTLDFSELEYGGASLNLAADDGVAFFTGFHGDTEYAYAGIFGTTDLGAPISTDGFGAVWNGALQLSGVADAIDFSLNVVFADGSGVIGGFITDINSTMKDLSITGTFDANGLITGNVHYDEFAGNAQLAITVPNGVLSGLIATDGAVAVFYNTAGELYVGGFVASPTASICATDVFNTDCPVNGNVPAQTAFCLNTTDNGGSNPFNVGCIEGTHDGDTTDALKTLRDTACLARGDAAHDTCKSRDEVRRLCDLNPFTLTGITTDADATICTGDTTDSSGITYASLRVTCETAATSFTANCNSQDAIGAVQTARDTYCETLATANEGNCSGRKSGICDTNGTKIFATLCGTATEVQDTFCSNDALENNVDCAGRKAGICDSGGTKIFATLCGTATAVQDTFCSTQAEANDANCASRMAGICTTGTGTNVFAPLCGANNAAETAFCVSNSATLDDNRCAAYQVGICGTGGSNIFATLCGTATAVQDTFCSTQAEANDANCASRMAGICTTGTGTNVFAPLCGANNAAETAFCVSNSATLDDNRCAAYQVGICGTGGSNIFATLCGTATAVQDTFCSTQAEANDANCASRMAGICTTGTGTNVFAPLCGANNAAETAFCVSNSATLDDNRCAAYQVGICGTGGSNIFATLCGTATAVQDTFCSTQAEANDANCASRMAGICTTGTGTNVFAPLCGANNAAETAFCVSNSATLDDNRCAAYQVGICGTGGSNIFATLCGTATAVQDTFCSTQAEANDANCASRMAGICTTGTGTNVFAPLCGDNAIAEIAFCEASSTPSDNLCTTRQSGICGTGGSNIFATLCGANDNVQIAFCESTPTANDPLCSGRKDGICLTGGSDVFAVLCGDNEGPEVAFCEATLTASDSKCSGRQVGICGTGGSNIFATLCGANDEVQIAFCKATQTENNVDCAGRQSAICDAGGTSVFSALCGTDTAGQLDACKGATNLLPATNSCATAGLSGVICGTSATVTGTNPFAPICSVQSQNSNYTNLDDVQELECRTNGNAGDGMPQGKCATIKNKFCDGADVGDNPYAAVCGGNANSANQETFCTDHGQANQGNMNLCSSSLATVCPGTPFRMDGTIDCLNAGAYDNDRAQQCRDGTQGAGDCNTQPIETAVCVATGTYSNPFAAFCGDNEGMSTSVTIVAVRQNFCGNARLSAGATNKDNCDRIQDNLCLGANSVSNDGQGAANFICLTDNEPAVMNARNTLCSASATTYTPGCETTHGATADAVLNTRNQLAVDCVVGGDKNRGTLDEDCNQQVAVGRTVAQCSANPYVAECEVAGVTEAFADVRTARADLCRAGDDPYNALCEVFPTRATQRTTYCRDTASVGDSNCGGDGNTATLCTTNGGTSPFATLCGTNVANQRTFCTTNRDHVGLTGSCADTITTFCDNSANDIFDGLCTDSTGTYDVARGTACVGLNASERAAKNCGNETSGYLQAYCAGDPTSAAADNARDCPNTAYADKNPTSTNAVVASDLSGLALNSDGTARLTGDNVFVSTGDRSNDTKTNFVNAGPSSLQLANVTTATPALKLFALSTVNTATDSESNVSGFTLGTDINNSNLLVGLLSGTNVGAPLSDGTKNGDWKTRIQVLTATGVLTDRAAGLASNDPETTTLSVSFDTKSIKTNNTAPTFGALGKIGIDGKFTANGVIYGEVTFDGANTLDGTLTGLIGSGGAVGIFKSQPDSDVSNPAPYVGGFVATPRNTAPPANCDDIEVDGQAPDPFNAECTENDDLQVRLCVDRHPLASAGGGQAVNCTMNDKFTSAVCITSGADANPFDSLCPDDAGKKKTFVNLCADQENNLDALGGSFACTGLIDVCLASPFASECGGAEYADVRSAAIVLCAADMTPFDAKCAEYSDRGTQRTSYCTTRASVGDALCSNGDVDYIVTLCGAGDGTGDGTNVFATVCTNANRMTFCTLNNIFDSRCNDNAHGDTDMARETACAEGGSAEDGQCTATVLRICDTEGKVFNSACLRANVSMTYHPARLLACESDSPNLLPADNSCNSDILAGAICGTSASDTGTDPFADICGISTQNSNFNNLAAVQDLQCRTKAIPADAAMAGDDCYDLAFGTNGFCDGDAAGDNPYAAVCGDANQLAQDNFCTNHGEANPNLCSSSLATVCPNTPFRSDGTIDCLSEGAYASHRAEQCSKGTQGTNNCNTVEIANAVCVSSGANANPFAAFCATADTRTAETGMTNADIRQAVYTACLDGTKDSDADVCQSTFSDRRKLRTATCIVNNPTALFAAECDYMEFKTVEVDYCTTTGNVWLTTCNSNNVADIDSRIGNARARICINNEAIVTDGGNGVADKMSLFNSRCTGLSVSGGATVADARTALAETCRTTAGADGCDQPADGLNGQTVAQCSANPYDTTDSVSCFANAAFNTERSVRDDLCTSSTSEPTSNPFDGLCDVFAGGGRDIVAERTTHCGTSVISPWDTKCEDNNLVTVGDTRISDARATICINNEAIVTTHGSSATVAAKSSLFNSLCTNLQTTSQTVLQARIALAATCTSTPNDDRCDAVVTTGVTARDCGNDETVGDPYRTGCHNNPAFTVQQEARRLACTMGGAAKTDLCANAILADICIENPHGQDSQSQACADTDAQTVRDEYCRGNDASQDDSLCDARQVAICASNDTPFASTCGPNDGIANADARQEACRVVGHSHDCTQTIAVFCGSPASPSTTTANLFDTALCDGSYDGARATACVNNDGVSDTCTDNGAGFNDWATNSGETILDAGGAVDSGDDANFIRGELVNGKLNLGAGTTIANDAVLTLDGASLTTGNDGFALGSNNFDSGTKLYVGLLSTTSNLGGPVTTTYVNTTWEGKLQYILGTTLSGIVDFDLTVSFDGTAGGISATHDFDNATSFTFNGNFVAGSSLITGGTAVYTIDADTSTGTLTGLIGEDSAIGIFASDTTATTDFVGGFFALAPIVIIDPPTPTVDCNPVMPFSDTDCDVVTDAAARLAEANRCYNNGGVVQTGGDCVTIGTCLSKTINGLFGTRSTNGVECSDVAFAGARANYCSAGINGNGGNIDGSLCKDFIAKADNPESACLTNPFTSDCEAKLGTAITTTSRTNRINYCITTARSDMTTTAGDNPCAGALTYCSTEERATCASTVPGANSDLITAFCGVFRNLSDAVCTGTIERTTSCDDNPFYTFCTEPGYITAQRTACGADDYVSQLSGFDGKRAQIQVADGRSNTLIDAAYCSTLNHTATLCAESGEHANPFATICDTDTNPNHASLTTTKQGYCRGDGLEANPTDCGEVASTFCATAGTDNAIAFDNLCRDATYDAVRVKACGADSGLVLSSYTYTVYADCTALVAGLCPGNPGCPLGDTVTTANWTSTLPGAGAVQADGTSRLTILPVDGVDNLTNPLTNYIVGTADGLELGFDQAAVTAAGGNSGTITNFASGSLKLSDLDGEPGVAAVAGDKDGVSFAAFANSANGTSSSHSATKFYAGLWSGTDLGAPLNNAEQSGTWSGKIALYAYGFVSSAIDFALTVTFNNGADGNLTADQTVDGTAFTIDGGFTSAGIIYGTTTFGASNRQSTGSLTGLIGAEGAVGAFVSSGVGNSPSAPVRNRNGEYAGGFVVKASVPVAVVDCTTTGTPFAMGCDEEVGIADVRTQLCLDDRTAANDSDNPTICGGLTMGFCFNTGANFGENPFDPRCNTETDIIGTRITLCEDDEAHPSCGLIIANNCPPTGTRHASCPANPDAVFADWTDSFEVGGDNAADTLLESGHTPAQNGASVNFIKLDDNDAIVATSQTAITTNYLPLNGALTSSAAGLNSGSAFGFGTDSEGNRQLYAGLLDSTDLGAPLTEATKRDGVWSGTISGFDLNGETLSISAGGTFQMTVAFGTDGGTIESVDQALHNVFFLQRSTSGGIFGLKFDGKFDANGVISGTANQISIDSILATGTFSGLIGANGAVGIFKGINAGRTSGYAGGFQLAPAAPDCTAATGNPFSVICTDNLAQQRIFVNDCADGTITEGCNQPITGVAGGLTVNQCLANPYNFRCGGRVGAFADVRNALDAVCGFEIGTNPFDNRCDNHPSQHVNQQNFCGDTRLTDGSQKQTDCDELLTRICAGSNSVLTSVGAGYYNCSTDDEFASAREVACGTANHAEDPVCRPIIAGLCTGAAAFESAVGAGNYPCSTDLAVDGARDAYCRTASVGDVNCDNERIARICLAGDSPFLLVCGAIDGSTHAVERTKACLAGATDSSCGSETSAGDSYLKTFCGTDAGNTNATYCPNKYASVVCSTDAGDTNITHCPERYAGAVVDNNPNLVDVSDLTGKVLNADGTGLERVVASGGANPANDARTNFIVGSFSGVALGLMHINGVQSETFRLNSRSGFAVALGTFRTTVTKDGVTSTDPTFDHYYYVGLLSRTNLGAPLPAAADDGATALEWSAQLRFMFGADVQAPQDFTLMVDLSGQTISGSAGGLLGFDIDGNFTDNGLIYGRFVSNLAGAGTLSGLIGEVGAVGIFKSNPGSGVYIGGFLADGSGNCTTTGNPFNADCKGNINMRVQLCLAWATDGLPNGVRVADVCAGDTAVTDVICATSGANANPFEAAICKGDQTSTQATFLTNCKAGNANGADCSVHDACALYPYGTRCDATVYTTERQTYTTLVNSCRDGGMTGEPCNAYTSCVANPYQTTCYIGSYVKERETYTESLLAYCSSDRTGATAPVGAPDCATPAIQADVCVASGTHANPLDAETCPDGYANLDAIQNEFTTTCYNARADLTERPECNNIATCFISGNLATTATSADGRFACNIAGLLNVKDLVICNGYVSGGALPTDCRQATIDKACTANPFLEVVGGEGIDCIGDRTRDQVRNQLCLGAESVQYDCTLTVSRACTADANSKYCTEDVADCTTDPFGDLCYDNRTYAIARLDACNGISAQITYDAVRMPKADNLLQNCLDAIDYECQYDAIEQFENDFCQIGTLYDRARGESCIAGTAPVDAQCGDQDSGQIIAAYCATDAALTDLANCSTNYALQNATAVIDVSVPAIGTGENQLLNSDGSAALSVIAAGGADDENDAPTNFIGITGGSALLATGTGTNRNGLALADTVSGFDFANSATNKLYVGLLEGTTLGAPLPSGTATSATWDATVSVLSYDGTGTVTPANTTFKLLVNYGGAGGNTLAVMGTETTIGTLGAFRIDGKFTNNGVIYGTVDFANGNAGTGTLTGLIGDAGAVGIFKSDASSAASPTSIAYVGGFTATAPVPTFPNYSSFVEHYGAQLPEGDDRTTDGGGGFLRGLPNTLNTAGLTLDSDLSRNVVVRLGEVASGHADYGSGFGVLRATNRYRAGLLSGTNLGAVLTPDVTAEWTGKAYVIRTRGTGSGDLTLTVDFNAGTINTTTAAFLTNDAGSLAVAGRFGSVHSLPDGILGGRVSYGSFNVPLIGLIGEKGVLGVFHAGSNQLSAGGFYATPAPVVIADGAGYTAFKNYYSAQTGSRQLFAEIASDARTGRGFLQGTRTGLVENNIRFDTDTSPTALRYDASHFNSIAVRLNEETTGDDGFAVLSGTTGGARFAVGLLSGTDLGAPLPTEAATTVEWTGSLHYANASSNGLTKSANALTLIVDVNEGTLRTKTRVEVSVGANLGTIRTIAIDGRFGERLDNEGMPLPGHLPASILGGTVSLYDNDGSGEGIKGSDSPLIGLIGAEGVLGVFTTSSLVGGFQASGVLPTGMKPVEVVDPTGPVGEVTGTTAYQAWAASFTGGANAALGDTLRASNYTTPAGVSADFIRLNDRNGNNDIVATNFDPNNGDLSAPLYLTGSTTSGVVYGQGLGTGGSIQLYAGLLPTTDLGTPIADGFQTATWSGTLAGYDHGGNDISVADFKMQVAFTGGAGTIKSFKADGTTLGAIEIGGFTQINFNGMFDEFGVISGTTTGSFNAAGADGTFNGLIGVDGAVGVFKGTGGTGALKGYVGGFQVSPSN